MKETKIAKFTSIFNLLDSDGDNKISKDKMDLLEEGIDMTEFIDAAMRLYDVSKPLLTLIDS